MNNIDTKLYPQYNFRFSGVKDTFDNYTLGRDVDEKLILKDKRDGTITTNKLMIDRMKFCISWFNSVGESIGLGLPKDFTLEDKKIIYNYAFKYDSAKVAYSQIMTIISKQLKSTGNIEPEEIKRNLLKYDENAYNIANKLFDEQRYLNAVDRWARYAIPDALQPTKPLLVSNEQGNIPKM